MSITRDLLDGLAADLAGAGLVTYDGGPGGNLFFKALPTSPDRCVAVTAYASQDEPKVARSRVRVQFYFRGVPDNSRDVDDLADEVFLWLHGREDFWYAAGTIHVIQAYRISTIQLGVDESKRSERSDNYEFDLDLPTTSGRPF